VSNSQCITSSSVVWLLHKNFCQVLFQYCSLSNSSSSKGGAAAASGNASVVFMNSTVQHNKASDTGGGLDFEQDSRGNMTHVVIASNRAEAAGGGLVLFDTAKVCCLFICPAGPAAKAVKALYIGNVRFKSPCNIMSADLLCVLRCRWMLYCRQLTNAALLLFCCAGCCVRCCD
jgi:hypothetical protein